MFRRFGRAPDYEKIFSSHEEIHKFIYGNRSKTSTILGDDDFIKAWLSSQNTGQVTSIIQKEALNGDIPSLKQMIWLSHISFEDAPNVFKDQNQLLKMRTTYLQDRIKYCQKAIDCGLKEQSYYAMTSSVELYNLYSSAPIDNPFGRLALLGIVNYAQMFLKSGTNETDLIQDTKDALEHFKPMAEIAARFATAQKTMETPVLNVNDIAKKLSQELGNYGTSELNYPRSLFSGKQSEKANITGSINGKSFQVIMFDLSHEIGIPSVSAHFSLNIKEIKLSEEQISFWNSDNRFTKIYRQDDDVYLVFDSFFPATEEENVTKSVTKIWNTSINDISKLKAACERRGIF